jgi:hypothetical protein
LYAFSRPVSVWFLLDFTGMKLFGWYCPIPTYPRSASSGIELLIFSPTVFLYTLKSCSLPSDFSPQPPARRWFPGCPARLLPGSSACGAFFPRIIPFLVLFRAVYRAFRNGGL